MGPSDGSGPSGLSGNASSQLSIRPESALKTQETSSTASSGSAQGDIDGPAQPSLNPLLAMTISKAGGAERG
jgi:hypothetical protein